MKTPSDDLFTLVKSLDKGEKIFFKVHSANKGSNNNSLSYLQLFNAIDKLKTHNESLLIARLKKSRFKHNFSKAKKYLTKAIFNSLRGYHSNISVNAELQQLLHLTEVLIEKKLQKLAKKLLHKAEKLALEYEMYEYLFVINALRTSLLRADMNPKDTEDDLNNGIPRVKKYFDRLKNIIGFNSLASEIRVIAAKHSMARGRDVNKINSILKSPLLSSPDRAHSFSALRNYYMIHHFCSKLLDKWDNTTYQRHKEWVTYLESDKLKLAERRYNYFAALVNVMFIEIKMGRMNEVEKSYEKIKCFYFSLPPKKRTKSILAIFAGTTSNYVGIHTKRGDPGKSLQTWEHIKGSVSLNKLPPIFFLAICNNLSQSHFMVGNYHDGLKWINKILSFREKFLLDVQAMARIYLLLAHYELGNYDMLPYLAKSSQRFLIKYNYFSEFEKIVVNFFEAKMAVANNKQEQAEAFSELKKKLEELLKSNQKIRALDYFDYYMSWIESKIENRSFAEIVKEKALQVKKIPSYLNELNKPASS